MSKAANLTSNSMQKNKDGFGFDIAFPDANSADENGIVALSDELAPSLVLSAYVRGIFPWHITHGKVFWYSPDPRAVLIPGEFCCSKSLAKSSKKYEIKINKDFDGVIKACSMVRRASQAGSWIDEEFIRCYGALHTHGFAFSVESYFDDELVGGLYGLRLGKVFFGESMFALRPDASKSALGYLCSNADLFDIKLIDCQQSTPHLMSLGAKEIKRAEFLEILRDEYKDLL
jgi:leucyl/phenylalanyl-tRNA---protein transferase